MKLLTYCLLCTLLLTSCFEEFSELEENPFDDPNIKIVEVVSIKDRQEGFESYLDFKIQTVYSSMSAESQQRIKSLEAYHNQTLMASLHPSATEFTYNPPFFHGVVCYQFFFKMERSVAESVDPPVRSSSERTEFECYEF